MTCFRSQEINRIENNWFIADSQGADESKARETVMCYHTHGSFRAVKVCKIFY